MTSCVINANKSIGNSKSINVMRNLLQKPSSLIHKKNMSSSGKNYKESPKWYCQICGLILTSKIQTQEHVFGKRHQNLVNNKNFYSKLKAEGERIPDKKGLIVFDGFQRPLKSSFNQNLGSGYRVCDSDDIIPPPAGRDNILETVIKSEKKTFYSSDLSIFRTPSGKYYCEFCDVSINSRTQFLQHSESRKHKNKANRASFRVK